MYYRLRLDHEAPSLHPVDLLTLCICSTLLHSNSPHALSAPTHCKFHLSYCRYGLVAKALEAICLLAIAIHTVPAGWHFPPNASDLRRFPPVASNSMLSATSQLDNIARWLL